ncbi:MAG: glycoside hydrolase family 3 [Ruminococcus sp.]|nr:glycoside hydrolase family 3 [Ruminococcus sp.]
MKLRKITAVLLGLSLLLTGCGRADNHKDDIQVPTDSFSSQEPGAEPIITQTAVPEPVETSPAAIAAETTVPTEEEIYTTEQPVQNSYQNNGYDNSNQQEQPQQSYNATEHYNDQPAVTTATYTPSANRTTVKTTTVRRTTAAVTTTTKATPRNVLKKMTLKQKVCQMFMVTPEAITGISPMTEVGNGTKNAMADYPVGGIIYFSQNLRSQNQIKTMISNTQGFSREACGVGLFTAVDEEGGKVARCAQNIGTTAFMPMEYYGNENNYKTAYDIGTTLGKDLSSLGFNVDFAPVADVNINNGNELGDRIFSSDPNVVANMICGVSKGLQDNGVSATLKHYPGLGAESGNTHTNSFVVLDRTMEQLRKTEFVPFKKGIESGTDFIMVGHQSVTGFGDNLPSDLSYKAITEILRGELKFKGIAITDAQQMHTISDVYTSGEAAKLSINAGMDIILMPVDYRAAIDYVCKAVENGEITESRIDESVLRILEKKEKLGLLKK